MILDDSKRRRQSKAGSAAHRLGGKKRLECAFLNIRRHAGTGISNHDLHITAGFHIERPDESLVEIHVFGFQIERTARFHRLPCVEIQVYQHLLDLVPVHRHGPYILMVVLDDSNFLFSAFEQVGGFLDDLVRAGWFDNVFTAPRVSQQLAGQVGAALNAALDAPDVLVKRVGHIQCRLHQARIALNAHEQVVEVVCDAAGQFSEGFQSLGLLQMLGEPFSFSFGLQALGDVASDAAIPAGRPVDAAYQLGGELDEARAAVFANDFETEGAETDSGTLDIGQGPKDPMRRSAV